jgi:prepilin-type N-terminal cleavage/methylation domain-containing protein
MKFRSRKGFTLIELMIVVVIIGILASMAIPRYYTAATKAKQSEAKNLLKQVFVMQSAYMQEHGAYWDPGGASMSTATPDAFASIQIQLEPPARYVYSIAVNQQHFVATANCSDPGIDTDPTADQWTIDDNGILVNAIDDVSN